MHAYRSDRVLSVNLSTTIRDTSKKLETKIGIVRWAMLDGTLLIQPEGDIDPSSTRHIEQLVRTVMKSSGLSRRYQVFSLHATEASAR